MQITPQTNREGLAPFVAHRLGHEPSALFWLLVDMVDKCPAISLQFARSMFKDTFTSAEIRQALADLTVIAPLWSLQPPVKDGPTYND
ncbi:TPA: hypothetical protein ACQ8SH_004810 [Escherichia coli]